MDWLTAPRNKDVKLLGQSTTKRPPKPTYLDLKKLKKDSIDGFLQEPGLKAFIRAYRKHSSDYLDDFVRFLIRAGRDDQIDLLTHHLRVNSENNIEFIGIFHEIHDNLFESPTGQLVLVDSGVISVFIDICFTITDNTLPGNINSDPLAMRY